jgi:hypothetical protein
MAGIERVVPPGSIETAVLKQSMLATGADREATKARDSSTPRLSSEGGGLQAALGECTQNER